MNQTTRFVRPRSALGDYFWSQGWKMYARRTTAILFSWRFWSAYSWFYSLPFPFDCWYFDWQSDALFPSSSYSLWNVSRCSDSVGTAWRFAQRHLYYTSMPYFIRIYLRFLIVPSIAIRCLSAMRSNLDLGWFRLRLCPWLSRLGSKRSLASAARSTYWCLWAWFGSRPLRFRRWSRSSLYNLCSRLRARWWCGSVRISSV